MTGDVLQAFVNAVVRDPRRIRRVMVVSPWITYDADPAEALARLLDRADRDGAALVLVTRPSVGQAHAAAIDAVERYRRGSVFLNPRLHAKLYVCDEGRGRGLVVVGSANMTAGSAALDEVAVLLRPLNGSSLIPCLSPTIIQLAGGRDSFRRSSASSTCKRRTAS